MNNLLRSDISKTATYPGWRIASKLSRVWLGTCAVFIAAVMVAPRAHADDAEQIVSTLCAACHGVDGKSTAPMFPNLAGQNSIYLKKQLEDFINGRRMNDLMSPAVAALKPKDVDALAAYYSARKLVNANNGSAPELSSLVSLIEAGKMFFRNGNPDTGVPGCTTCHREDNAGDKSYPKLFGQDALYTAKQLADLKAGVRTNDNYRLMRKAVTRMTADEMRAVAEYLAVAGR